MKANALALHAPQTTPALPPGWQSDPRLGRLLPGVDTTTLRPLTEAPDRYAVCIASGAVWSLSSGSPVSQQITPKGRARVRLFLGGDVGARWFYVSRLVCAAAYGPAPGPDYEAHHISGDTRDDSWSNLRWVTPHANRAASQRQRNRPAPHTELTFNQLGALLQAYHLEGVGPAELSRRFALSRMQIWRIINTKSRTVEVSQLLKMLDHGFRF